MYWTSKVQYCHHHDSMYYYKLPSCTKKKLNTKMNNILTSVLLSTHSESLVELACSSCRNAKTASLKKF